MPPQDPIRNPANPRINNPLAVTQPGEQTLFELKRHPIGIFIIYGMTIITFVTLAVIAIVVAPALATGESGVVKSFAAVGLMLFAALSLIFNMIATTVYWGNRWILTSDSITQFSQTGLFHKENSQITLDSIEDVTAAQDGILQRLFNYGTLKVETAGHGIDYAFPFASNPNLYARQILEACEQEGKENNRSENVSSPTDPIY